MVNTNGIRIAQDRDFARRLAEYMPGFEIYLQFDSFEAHVLEGAERADLRRIRQQAIDHLNEFNISTTLVVTLKKASMTARSETLFSTDFSKSGARRDDSADSGSRPAGGYDPATDRLTVSEVRRMIIDQSEVFTDADILPVPCHPDCLAMGYALKLGGEVCR